jgi:hypothetical protein
MGYFQFRRRIKIAPGVHWNIGKKGSSVSFGGHGLSHTIGPQGSRTTIGIPGTGVSYTHVQPHSTPNPPPPTPTTSPPSPQAPKKSKPSRFFYILGVILLPFWLFGKISPSVPKPGDSPEVRRALPVPPGAAAKVPLVRTRGDGDDELDVSGLPPATASPTSESSLAPSPLVDERERKLEELRKRAEASFAAQSPTIDPDLIQPTVASPQTYRVIKVKRGDSLKVRTGPGQTDPVITTLAPGTRGILLLSERIANGSTMWQKISVDGNKGWAGWVNEIYLEAEFPRAVPRAVEVR